MSTLVFTTVELAALLKAVPLVIEGIKAGQKPTQLFATIEPALLPVFETIAGDLFPFGGVAVDLVACALLNQKQLSPAEQKLYDDAYNARVQAI